jgi:hypothetical protein
VRQNIRPEDRDTGKSLEERGRALKTLAGLFAVLFFSCASSPDIIYVYPQKEVRQHERPEVWSLYLGPSETGTTGMMDEDQQIQMIYYICNRMFELNDENFKELYGTSQICIGKNIDGMSKTFYALDKIKGFERASSTIGYNCMKDALKGYCFESIGFCLWDGVWVIFEDCVEKQ